MSERFFVDSKIEASQVELKGAEARHAAKVMRLGRGDTVTLFDGSGCEFTAQIHTIGRDAVRCEVTERRPVSRERPNELILCVALPKGDRQRWLVEKAVELGVTRLIPLAAQRGVAQPTDSALARNRRAVVEASKQCGRNVLMEIDRPQHLRKVDLPKTALRWLAHPDSPPLAMKSTTDTATAIAVGPEGGFTQEEVAEAVHCGWIACSLGPRILRVETAALAFAARVGRLEDLP